VLKLLSGTLRKDRDVKPKVKRPPAGAKCPSPPSWLGRIAKEEWRRVAPFLFRRGLLTKQNVTELAAYCQSCARWREYEKVVDESGTTFTTEKGYVCQRPEVTLSQKERVMMSQFGTKFGITPDSANFGTDEPDAPRDVTADFLFGKPKEKGA
jgi:P27 family predicted phage terminase small subunit